MSVRGDDIPTSDEWPNAVRDVAAAARGLDMDAMWSECRERIPALVGDQAEFAKTFFMLGVVNAILAVQNSLSPTEVAAFSRDIHKNAIGRLMELVTQKGTV